MKVENTTVVYSAEPSLRHPVRLVSGLIHDLARAKELIWSIFLRDLRAQFRQSILGYFWLLLPPVATAAVWLLLQSQKVLRVETEIPYPLFILIGTTIWISFVNFVNAPLLGFNSGKSVYSKLNVSPEAFVISSILRAVLNTLVRVTILIPVFIWFKFTPPATAFLFPIAAFFFFSIGIAIGILCIPFGSLFTDIGNFLRNFIRLLMYICPVIYPIRKAGWFGELMQKNPFTPGVAWCRDLITTGEMTWALPTIVIGSIGLLLSFVAFVFLRVARPHLIARLGM
ncbi:MAG: hypothetical protein CMO55_20200 [Verrucomicrobiales bacterium]|nr:hypothetical protein [Verrucomicrobiales bacterium]